MALGAAERVDERLEAEAAGVEGLDGILPQALPLRAVPKLPLLLVREEGEVIVVLRVPLRHLRSCLELGSKSGSVRGIGRRRLRSLGTLDLLRRGRRPGGREEARSAVGGGGLGSVFGSSSDGLCGRTARVLGV